MSKAFPPIEKIEVLRYLGYRGQAYDNSLDALLHTAMATCVQLARPKQIAGVFGLEPCAQGLRLAHTHSVLTGNDIAVHLAGATKVVLVAATLGVDIDTEIRRLEHTDITASLMLDASATDAIEKYTDMVEAGLRSEAMNEGLHLGTRYSPGYGDLPLTLQHDMLRLLDTSRRIGLTCLDSAIMLPRKSVTAVLGYYTTPQRPSGIKCQTCALQAQCTYRACTLA